MSYFAYDYNGPAYELFGTGHLVSIGVVCAVIAFLLWGWQDPDEQAKRRTRLTIFTILLLNEIGWHSWNLYHGGWSVSEHIPLHLCGVGIWSSMFVLLTRNYRVFEIVFFFGIVGAAQAILTPSAGEYGWPHFRAFQTTISHSMLVIAMVYMAAIEGLRPTWRSVWRTMVFLNVYLVFVTGVNYVLGSNYMFTMEKPATASLFDYMGPWPWYLLAAEVLAVILFSLLYLPFALSDRRARQKAAAPVTN